jgi:magnesium transporter
MRQALLIEGDRRTEIEWPRDRERWENGQGILWLDVGAADSAELEQLGRDFGLHPLVVRACIHPEHRARIKEFKDHLLLVLNAVGRVAGGGEGERIPGGIGRWRTLELDVVVGRRFMLTVHPESVPAVTALFIRVGREGEGRPTLEYLLFGLSEAVTSGYYVVLDRIDKYIDDAESLIFKGDVTGKVVDRLFGLKRHILYLRRVLGPQRDALGALMRREFAVLAVAEARPYFVDVYEHTLRLFDLLDTYRDLISSSLDAYLSTVSNRMNEIMKVLTIVSTIMLPLSLISGIFGMNFANIPWIAAPWGFWAAMGLMVGIGFAMYAYFKRRKWM